VDKFNHLVRGFYSREYCKFVWIQFPDEFVIPCKIGDRSTVRLKESYSHDYYVIMEINM
jgi:hypothetical protein